MLSRMMPLWLHCNPQSFIPAAANPPQSWTLNFVGMTQRPSLKVMIPAT